MLYNKTASQIMVEKKPFCYQLGLGGFEQSLENKKNFSKIIHYSSLYKY